MGIYSKSLPQLQDKVFITDGGLETILVFHQNIDLPEFAAYDLMRTKQGYQTLSNYYKVYAELALKYQIGIILETPTWRSNPDWGKKIGDTQQTLDKINTQSVALVEQVRKQYATVTTPIVISGCIGPRGDGYVATNIMTASQAKQYHRVQMRTFATTNVDLVSAFTINYAEEAIGITLAAQEHDLPVCISFTVETDGKLPTGETLEKTIDYVDQETNNGPAYYMINCAHPTHLQHLFTGEDSSLNRIKGIRSNASCLSHAELDEAEELDEGNPVQFGLECGELKSLSPQLTVLGGCCGTDHRHIEQICINLI